MSKECLVISMVNKYAVKFNIVINLLSFSYDGTPTHNHIAVNYLLEKHNFPSGTNIKSIPTAGIEYASF